MSGKLTSKPDDAFRDKLKKRDGKALIDSNPALGRLTDAQKKSPSQKRSESFRKRKRIRDCETTVPFGFSPPKTLDGKECK